MPTSLSDSLLAWYDVHARPMPWRVAPLRRKSGVAPDPYRIWLSEIMLQQTTVAAVGPYFQRFTSLWPTVRDLAAAQDARVMAEWAGLGYYARARNLLKCARVIVADHAGIFPDNLATLLTLPGIGPYTASAIASIAFDHPETVVDGNVERVMARMHAVREPLPTSKPQLTALAAKLTPQKRPGEYAQAVMDLGATICTPRNPACGICPWIEACAGRKQGIAADLPAKLPKKAKPTRHGIAYVARREDGAWLLETRPEKGLLGGMLGWPGTEWSEETPAPKPPLNANWQDIGEVRHTFTHFHLILAIRAANLPKSATGDFTKDFTRTDLPTVMRKAYDLVAKSIAPK